VPTASILTPFEGDTITQAQAVVTASITGFNGAMDFTAAFGAVSDPTPPKPPSGATRASSSNALPPKVQTGVQTVTVSSGGTELDSQGDVTVTANPPLTIHPPPSASAAGAKTSPGRGKTGGKKVAKAGPAAPITVTGTVPDATAAYVVCQIIAVNTATAHRHVVGTGAATVKSDFTWAVDVAVALDNPDVKYLARAFAYSKTQRHLGSQTIVFK
jgi:hypothetical protein